MQKIIEISNETGLHARPASEFVMLAKKMSCDVYIEKDGKRADGKSILGLLSLGLNKGTSITLITDGQNEAEGLESLCTFVEGLEG